MTLRSLCLPSIRSGLSDIFGDPSPYPYRLVQANSIVVFFPAFCKFAVLMSVTQQKPAWIKRADKRCALPSGKKVILSSIHEQASVLMIVQGKCCLPLHGLQKDNHFSTFATDHSSKSIITFMALSFSVSIISYADRYSLKGTRCVISLSRAIFFWLTSSMAAT